MLYDLSQRIDKGGMYQPSFPGFEEELYSRFTAVRGNRDFVRTHPVATKRVLRAILKATDYCASDAVGAARRMVDRGFTTRYDYALQTLSEVPYNKWREYDHEDTIRFYGLRLREAGMIKSLPNKIIADATDWRFLNELKRELKG